MLGMKNHFDISGSIEIREVDIAGVACISQTSNNRLVQNLSICFSWQQSYAFLCKLSFIQQI